MLKAYYNKQIFRFRKPSGTSRGVLLDKNSWFIVVYDDQIPAKKGIGECSIIRGLSIDDRPDFEQKLLEAVNSISNYSYWLNEGLNEFPSIKFGLETALKDLNAEISGILFPSEFTSGERSIPINGLIWMGDTENMYQKVKEKVDTGFNCIKIKIGAINFEDELKLLKRIRIDFSERDLELRVDANGAFKPDDALEKLEKLSEFNLHSIEQPIKKNQWKEMANLCQVSPVPIALDEELIEISEKNEIKEMLNTIQPQYIILKPSLIGGLQKSELFIKEAEKRGIGWWVTSALESNIGLNVIAQWVYTLNTEMHQGLGTGQLFVNNIPSPLNIKNARLNYGDNNEWNFESVIND